MPLRPRDPRKAQRRANQRRREAARRWEEERRRKALAGEAPFNSLEDSRRARDRGSRELDPLKAERRAAEWARAYGSEARVLRMKARDCDGCGRAATPTCPNETAHLGSGGTGRKAGWQNTVTLCGPDFRNHRPGCHQLLDQHYGSVEAFDEAKGTDLRATAARLAREIPKEG